MTEPVRLKGEDWEEIYYALDYKRSRVERGDYGTADDPDVDIPGWIAQLNWILTEIGPDGKEAAKRGVAQS